VYAYKLNRRIFSEFHLWILINTASSAAPQATLCEPGLLRLRHWQSDTLTTRLDLIHYSNKNMVQEERTHRLVFLKTNPASVFQIRMSHVNPDFTPYPVLLSYN
jgi:hypothetical protein